MSYQVPNSNQFASWLPGTFLTPADYLQGTPGNKVPSTQDASLNDETEIQVQFILRRNTFETTERPKGFIKANDIPNLPYKKQVSFINNLSRREIRDWYGSSADDMEAVTSYLLDNNATILKADQEKRSVKAKLTLGDFRSAFLAGRKDIIFSEGIEDLLYYYNPDNYADSYLTAEGSNGGLFAQAVIGSRITLCDISSTIPSTNTPSTQENNTTTGKASFGYYPREVADQYNFPSQRRTGGGKGVGLGIVGTGGVQLEKYASINNALTNYLKAQGVNTKRLGDFFSPNTTSDPSSDKDAYAESSLDYSIARSVSPKSDIYISQDSADTNLYESLAELIYNDEVDIISSSAEFGQHPGTFNLTKALNELFIDGLIRGQTIVQASGDVGSSNNRNFIPNGIPFPSPSDSPAVLSVGGTALNKKAQDLIWPRSQVTLPTAFPPSFSPKVIDELTGLISNQYTWKTIEFEPLTDKDRLDALVYPTVSNQFTAEDFSDSIQFGSLEPRVVSPFENEIGSSGVQDSSVLPMPTYQKRNLDKKWLGLGGRRYPDVSAFAGGNDQKGSTGFYYILDIITNDDQTDFVPQVSLAGGTSASAPLVAGLLANLTSYVREKFGKKQNLGMVNPLLYETYNSKSRKKTFFDVPAGSNNANVFTLATSPDEWSGYTLIYTDDDSNQKYLIPVNGTGPGGQLDTNLSSTGRGFDAATGLGSINGEGLLDQLVSVFSQL